MNRFRDVFPKVQDLSIYIPLINDLYRIIPTLFYLRSLDLVFIQDGNFAYSQLQSLFDRAPNLYSVTIGMNSSIQLDFSKLTSNSIRRLNFLYKVPSYSRSFDDIHSNALACSSLGRQCEVLLIEIENQMNLIDLIQQMFNLKSLTFRICDENTERSNARLLTWLRIHLPSTCTCTRDVSNPLAIKILIST